MKTSARSLPFDYATSIASVVVSSGILLDTWAHGHVPIETFFTPFHALIYAGMFAIFAIFIGYGAINRALPPGYHFAALGIPLFLLAGLADMGWHVLYGVEQGVDAILSPTHQALGAGILLLSIGPIRSVLLDRDRSTTMLLQMPFVLGLIAMLQIAHFGTAYALDPAAGAAGAPPRILSVAHTYFTALALTYYKTSFGVLIAMFQAILTSTFALWTISRIRLFPGALTLLFLLGNAPAAAAFSNETPLLLTTIAQSLIAGLVADWLVASRDPQPENPVWYRIFAFFVPLTQMGVYIVATQTGGGIWWDWDVTLGAWLWCGACGFFLSLLGTARRRTA